MNVSGPSLLQVVVQKGSLSKKDAVTEILSGSVLVNGRRGTLQQVVQPEDGVQLGERLIKPAQAFTYLAYYKPRGIETTLNPAIPQNLRHALPLPQRVFPVGRLDKESEGLLLLTDDGSLYNRLVHAQSHQEKEYVVTVDKPLTPDFLKQMAEGVVIMGEKTRPATVQPLTDHSFSIVLTQGRNRQIRRMCYKLKYDVCQLVRTRMVSLHLQELQPGQWRHLTEAEILRLKECMAAPAP